MSYSLILTGFLIFAATLALHVAVWRLFKPIKYMAALVPVFLALPLAAVVLLAATGVIPAFTLLDWAFILLMHFSLASAYILSYPAIQARCPSLTMLLVIEGRKETGGAERELLKDTVCGGDLYIEPRLDDLLLSGFSEIREGRYIITGRGRRLLKPFLLLRSLLALPMGRG